MVSGYSGKNDIEKPGIACTIVNPYYLAMEATIRGPMMIKGDFLRLGKIII